jgi:hypothetical protein
VGVVLGALAGVVLAVSILIDADRYLRPYRLEWAEAYVRLAGVAAGGLILATGLLVVGIGVGRVRRTVPSQHRRSPEVRW